MQVFLPYPDFPASVACLDPKRLGNQIYRECKTLASGGWPNHPASKIWRPHLGALALYALAGLDELTSRGRYYPIHYDFFNALLDANPDTSPPPIVGFEPFHAGHRAALLAKDFAWYGKFGWAESPEPDTKLAYVWSVQ